MGEKIHKGEAEWRSQLTPEQYQITRECGTEPPFTGKYWKEHAEGTYQCVCCGQPLFGSGAKFESGSGWPSFYQAVRPDKVATREDTSHGMVRTEVTCANCGAHLGHLFPDGPPPTRQRYCINSAALNLVKK